MLCLRCIFAAVAVAAFSAVAAAQEVCFEGYVMDRYCIDRGTLFDAPTLETLQNPGEHSIHCLVDVGSCVSSVYELLSPEATEGKHCRAYQLDSAGHAASVALAREVGECTTCNGPGSQRVGFRATVLGSVVGSTEPPTLAVTSVANSSVGCPDGNVMPAAGLLCEQSANLPFIRAHGSLMLLSWGLLLPTGVAMAHFMKHRPDGLWFKLHRAIQVTGLTLAVAGWLVAVTQFDVFSAGVSARSLAHGSMGMVTMALGVLQPINAYFRPHPDPPSAGRRAWERLHKTSGYIAVLLGLATAALGTMIAALPGFSVAFPCALVLLLAVVGLAVRDRAAQKRGGESTPAQTQLQDS